MRIWCINIGIVLGLHQQLMTNSFDLLKDEYDREYVVISHETKQKKYRPQFVLLHQKSVQEA
jgi:hypothetical protein